MKRTVTFASCKVKEGDQITIMNGLWKQMRPKWWWDFCKLLPIKWKFCLFSNFLWPQKFLCCWWIMRKRRETSMLTNQWMANFFPQPRTSFYTKGASERGNQRHLRLVTKNIGTLFWENLRNQHFFRLGKEKKGPAKCFSDVMSE